MRLPATSVDKDYVEAARTLIEIGYAVQHMYPYYFRAIEQTVDYHGVTHRKTSQIPSVIWGTKRSGC